MKRYTLAILLALIMVALTAAPALAKQGDPGRPQPALPPGATSD